MVENVEDFEALVQAAFDQLPDQFRDACKGLGIRTEAFAAPDVMSALGLSNRYELLGLYHGINLARKSVFALPTAPDEVILYREAIIGYAARQDYPLADVIRNVLVHEIGHHFGLSDADMATIERQA